MNSDAVCVRMSPVAPGARNEATLTLAMQHGIIAGKPGGTVHACSASPGAIEQAADGDLTSKFTGLGPAVAVVR